MKLIGLLRLGRDAEVRYTTQGDPVCTFSGAFNYGRKGDDGKRPTQWVDCSIWGERGEKLSPYLLKGTTVSIVAEPHVETYEKRGDGGTGVRLVAKIDDIEFAGRPPEESAGRSAPAERTSAPAPRQATAPAPRQAPKSGTGFDDMDDDIPF